MAEQSSPDKDILMSISTVEFHYDCKFAEPPGALPNRLESIGEDNSSRGHKSAVQMKSCGNLELISVAGIMRGHGVS